MVALNPPTIRGAKAIAHELGCSPRTVSRLAANGKLPVKKGFSGGPTSPLIAERKALENFKCGNKD
ncbi:helix-turn-helix domain-containing protein [Ancylobacter sp. MQZ15Z-1]|uniref:Helix-turn-helix domain-containing protein n=1 Tax=Ancylobacter mangrovi TaxID=2972472 RepID=A0A9X2P970_9HYPH|nr:helix-turn-helix domain-containing protein [Ancylobacter mangrovi]MCS0494351.1 helix-turn-helix domain-containing protein [Ancylobacter mangrovi]